MREWGFIAPSRVGRTQRPKVLSVAWRFLRPPSPSLAANKAGLHHKGMSLSGPTLAGSLKFSSRHQLSHSLQLVQPFSSQRSN